MDSRYIVALEIGSSKITGAVALVEPETSDIKVLAIYSTPLINSVRYGRVQNVQEVSATVNDIIRKLENHPIVTPRHVSQVFIALGGRSFTTVNASGSLQLPNEIEITPETIERLKHEASYDILTGKDQVSIEPRKYFVANSEVKNIVGTFGKSLRGEFTAIICSPENKRNLERVKLTTIDTPARHYIPRPVAIADMVLTTSEKQLGCAMIDFGAETTTVTIYKDGKLQFISTVPLGGRNITLDLMAGMSLTEDRAEQLKLTLGTAISDRDNPAPNPNQPEIDNYVQARTGEIIANAINQITAAGFKVSDLPSGIIIVGGGSKLREFNRLLENLSKMKVHRGDIDSAVKVLDNKRITSDYVDVIAILRYAARTTTENCLKGEDPELNDAIDRMSPSSSNQNNHDHGTQKYRDHIPDENDDDLLQDDLDDEEDAPTKTPKQSRSWSIFGSKKKKKAEDEYSNYDDDDDDNDNYVEDNTNYDDDNNYDDDDDEINQPQTKVNKNNRGRIIRKLADIGKSIFGNPEDDE